MDDRGVMMSDAIEQAALTRIADIYNGALRRLLRQKAGLLRKIAAVDAGKINPPDFYALQGEDGIRKWREGWMKQLFRDNKLIEAIMRELNACGVEAEKLIRGALADVYAVNKDFTVDKLTARIGNALLRDSFAVHNRREVEIIIREGESPFSQMAYDNIKSNPVVRRRLENSLAEACILGESQQKIIQRIQKITGQTYSQAKRVAQTERTRVQSQARYETCQEAAQKGVVVVYEWSARMIRTRESHAALNGKKVMDGTPFVTIWGNLLRYPGDPSAPAREVINCFCVLVPDVLLPGQWLDEDGNVREAA